MTENLRVRPRAEQVLWLLSGGMTDKEIARTMGISHRTVEVYMHELRTALNMQNRLQMITWVLTSGWRPKRGEFDFGKEVSSTCNAFLDRLKQLTGDEEWRHPNLAAAIGRLKRIEEDLQQWSQNQQLEIAEEQDEEENENVDAATAQ